MAVSMEIKGSRKEWTKGNYIFGERFYVSLTRDPAGGLPNRGDGFVNAAGQTESSPGGRLMVDHSSDHEILPGIWLHRFIYRAFRIYAFPDIGDTSGNASLYECENRKELRLEEEHHYTATRSFIAKAALADSLARVIYNDKFSAALGDYTPRCDRIVIRYHPLHTPDTALIVAHYKTPLIVGKAKIEVRMTWGTEKTFIDIDGKVIEGPNAIEIPRVKSRIPGAPVPPASYPVAQEPLKEWEVIEGTNTIFTHRCEILVTTAVELDYLNNHWDDLWYLRGTVNRFSFRISRNLDAQTLIFKGAYYDIRYQESPVPIHYYFDYEPLGWNNVVKSRAGTWIIVEDSVSNNPDVAPRAVKTFARAWDKYANDGAGAVVSSEDRRPYFIENWSIYTWDNANW